MSTHDYILDNQNGLTFRTDLNSNLSAIVSNNSNAVAPTIKYPYMWWADTTSNTLKLRNPSNTTWVEVLDLITGESIGAYTKAETDLLLQSIEINDLTDAYSDLGLLSLGLGEEALGSNTTGNKNIAVGSQALESNTTGSANIAVGSQALESNTTGNNNIAIGNLAAPAQMLGSGNIAIGSGALYSSTEGTGNIAIGTNALEDSIAIDGNMAIGGNSLTYNTTGSHNTCSGESTSYRNTSGSNNVALGYSALFNNTTGLYNTAVGHEADSANTTGSHRITIGGGINCIADNYFTMGSPGNLVYNNFTANATWTRASDERIKKAIERNEDCGLNFINDLRTVTYKFKAPSELDSELSNYNKEKTEAECTDKMYGFIAQEVKGAMVKNNITDFAGHHQIDDGKDNMQGISYEMFVVPLVKSVQELSAKNKVLEQELADTNSAVAGLLTRIEVLENK